MWLLSNGSSPLTRGKHLQWLDSQKWSGLIPAHAGKTGGRRSRSYDSPAHPRSRGENQEPGRVVDRRQGSSPLTRGKHNSAEGANLAVGLIPAHAGKTPTSQYPSRSSPAHPRSRGENAKKLLAPNNGDGSSPLTRGKPPALPSPLQGPGLIPAHAGKTPPPMLRSCRPGAHPRSRGENQNNTPWPNDPPGSSPLTRGKRWLSVLSDLVSGLIPAHAGKTFWWDCSRRRAGAHPRSRGENMLRGTVMGEPDGSSPLTRGKPPGRAHGPPQYRLIPAHAGKTPAVKNLTGFTWAHPRSRGENHPSVQAGMSCRGSSPLTRGKHFLTCVFTAQIDQILETLELAASFGSYLIWVACATDAPQDPVRSIGLVLPSSRGAS